MAHARFLPTRNFSESEKSQLRPPLSRKRCTGRSSSRVREVLRIEFYLIGQSLELRERRRALFHSTPEGPIDRGTIQQAIWSKTQIYLMVTKTFARFSPDFIHHHDQLHPADQPELHLRHHRLQLQQGEHRGGGTGPCTHCRGGAESVLTLSSTVIGVGLHRLGANLTRRKGKYTSASPRCTCLPSRQICIGVALGDPPQTPLQC